MGPKNLCWHTGKEEVGHHVFKCRLCKIAYMKNYRKTKGKQYSDTYNKKIYGSDMELAKRKVYIAVRSGFLSKASTHICADCGKQAFCYDHRDYSQPLKVEPVCRTCNQKRGPAKKVPRGTFLGAT